jgi:hypothetical protein
MAVVEADAVNGGPVLTIREFLERNRISKTTFHKLRIRGLGPRQMICGRITPQAEADWRLRMEEEAASAEAQLAAARRVELAKRAARAAAASPAHVSKHQAGKKRLGVPKKSVRK